MSATVLPELAAESVELAERLVRLSAGADLDPAEAEYLLTYGLAAVQRVPRLWPIVRGRIARGTTGAAARLLLCRLLNAVNGNLSLAGILKILAQTVNEQLGRQPEAGPGLDEAEARLLAIQAEGSRLLAAIDAPARWPAEDQLRQAKDDMEQGARLSAEELRRALLGA